MTAKAVGSCTITAKHKIFGTTAKCTVNVTKSVTLGTKAKEQSNGSCCSGAAAATVLRYIKGSSKSDLELWREMGSTGNVGKIVNLTNRYLGKSVYKFGTYGSQTSYQDAVIRSINAGYPVIALVKIKDKGYFKYTSNGHFTVISGYRINTNGSVDFRITDSFKTKSNGGCFWIPAKTLFSYSKSH